MMLGESVYLVEPGLAHQLVNDTGGTDPGLLTITTPWADWNGTGTENGTANMMDENKFILPVWRQILWSVLFAGMIVVSTTGNIVVIWIVLKHKRMRTVTNYFLVNLSIADTMVSTLNVMFNYVYMLNSHWPFGRTYCKVNQFISVITICASVFTLVAISIDRYIAIVNPLKPRMGKRTTLCIALAIWIAAAFVALPNLLFYETYTFDNPITGEERVVCYSDWPDAHDTERETSNSEYWYNVFFMILTYFLPIGSMTFTYARIGLELWGSQSIGEATQRQLDNIRNKRRVVKMMMVVVIIFAVCWLPFHVYFIVTSHFPHITMQPYVQEVYLGFYWLAMSNSMYNPIIYCWMNSRFRRGFAQVFKWVPWVNPEPALSRSEAVTSRYSCAGSPEVRGRLARNGTMRLPLHLQETTTTQAFAESGFENGNSARRRDQQQFNYRTRLPYTARFQKLDSQMDS